MKKIFLSVLFTIMAFSFLHAQLSLTKMVGKNADKYKLGYDIFTFYNFPLNEEGNKSVQLELLDFAWFRGKDGDGFNTGSAKAYVSIKVGYKNIFSETKTGFYLEPSVGYCNVVDMSADQTEDATSGNGIAAALEGGYSLEVGQKGHTVNLGLKYETDRAGSLHTISSVGFRVSYQFNMFRKKTDY